MLFKDFENKLHPIYSIGLDTRFTEGVKFTSVEFLKRGKFFKVFQIGNPDKQSNYFKNPYTKQYWDETFEKDKTQFSCSKILEYEIKNLYKPYSGKNLILKFNYNSDRKCYKPYIFGENLQKDFRFNYICTSRKFLENNDWFIIDDNWENWNNILNYYTKKRRIKKNAPKRLFKRKMKKIFSYKHIMYAIYTMLALMFIKVFINFCS